MVNDTAQPADKKPESEEPLTWEKQKNQEFKTKFNAFTKRFAIGFLILVAISLTFHFADYDIEDEVGPSDYSISILSSLTFFSSGPFPAKSR